MVDGGCAVVLRQGGVLVVVGWLLGWLVEEVEEEEERGRCVAVCPARTRECSNEGTRLLELLGEANIGTCKEGTGLLASWRPESWNMQKEPDLRAHIAGQVT